MAKAIVFGGSGFLGSHVADVLTDRGYDTSVFDLRQSRYISGSQKMITGDLLDQASVDEAIYGCEIVFNFAGLADLNEALDQPKKTITHNILGNVNILDACVRQGVSRFVYASSIYVFSRDGGFYKCSKAAAEGYVEEYNRRYNLDYTILRYGSLYGPRSDEKNGLYRLVKQALVEGVVRYGGSKDSLREYIHVEDAAAATIDALSDAYKNQSIVLTGHEPMKVYDVLSMLSEIIGRKIKIEFSKSSNSGHYARTPYAYQPKSGKKFVSPLHVDLGQGLLQLVAAVDSDISSQ